MLFWPVSPPARCRWAVNVVKLRKNIAKKGFNQYLYVSPYKGRRTFSSLSKGFFYTLLIILKMKILESPLKLFLVILQGSVSFPLRTWLSISWALAVPPSEPNLTGSSNPFPVQVQKSPPFLKVRLLRLGKN